MLKSVIGDMMASLGNTSTLIPRGWSQCEVSLGGYMTYLNPFTLRVLWKVSSATLILLKITWE